MYTRSSPVSRQKIEAEEEDDDDRHDLTGWIQYRSKSVSNNEITSSWIRGNQNTYMGEIRQLSKFNFRKDKLYWAILSYDSFRPTNRSKTPSILSCQSTNTYCLYAR